MVERVEAWACSDGTTHITQRGALSHELAYRVKQAYDAIPSVAPQEPKAFSEWLVAHAGVFLHALEPFARLQQLEERNNNGQ